MRNVVLAMLATALFLGACLVCSSGAGAERQALVNIGYVCGAAGFALMVYVFVTVRKD